MADRREDFENRFVSALESEQAEAETSRQRQGQYDAKREAATAASGAFEHLRPRLEEMMSDFRGTAVGAGRIDSGFQTEGEDRLVRGAFDDLNNVIAQRSMEAASLNLRNIEGRATSQNRYLEALTAGMDREQAEANARYGFDDFMGQAFATAGAVIPFI